MAGMRREDLKVQVEDGNILEISGERVKEEERVNDKWHRMERRLGSFTRRFRLPENVNVDEIECGLEHGLLTVNVPKEETQERNSPIAGRGGVGMGGLLAEMKVHEILD
ncbi:hypothetical protein K7X08_027621 [Anisodus acutangulus]|uniref:SHSP domain-containing protein n=1 Tax=Anisodus acutangulus TaxID=402998 RepID=A0A9Q1MJQ4_9SOLA|nr:hypothetical protein K7X08_027621 [Anisodus acutangulus]